MGDRPAVDGEIGGEEPALLAQLAQAPLGRDRDPAPFDPLQRLLLLILRCAHPNSLSSAVRASVLRSSLGLQIAGQRRHPRAGVECLALDRDASHLTFAEALHVVSLDGQLVAVAAELDPYQAHVLLAAAEQAPAAALDVDASRQRLLQLACQHLDGDPKVGTVRAQAGGGEVEVLLGRHAWKRTPSRWGARQASLELDGPKQWPVQLRGPALSAAVRACYWCR